MIRLIGDFDDDWDDDDLCWGPATPSLETLVRSTLWSDQLKEMLMDDLMSMKFVRLIGVPAEAKIMLPTPVAVAVIAAAIIIKNPEVTRRFWNWRL